MPIRAKFRCVSQSRKHKGKLADHGIQHPGQQRDVFGLQLATLLQRVQCRCKKSQGVGLLYFLEPDWPENDRCFLDDDPAVDGLKADVEVGINPSAKPIPDFVLGAGARLDPCSRFDLELHHHGIEQCLLVVKVVIKRATRDACGARDRFDASGLVAVLGKGCRASLQQCPPRRLGALLAARPDRLVQHRLGIQLDQ